MNQLEKAIQNTLNLSGNAQEANKAYLEFIKANFLIPIDKQTASNEPQVLFYQEGENTFLPVFTSRQYLENWAIEIKDSIEVLNLSGVNLLKGIGDDVIVAMNIGSSIYKEFNASELARMRSMILKLFK